MKYEKPNVAMVASAVEAVKSDTLKGNDLMLDSRNFVTHLAYQGDE